MEMKLQLFGEPLDYRLLMDEEEPLFLAAEEEEEDEPAGDGDGDGSGEPDDGDAEDEEIVADADEAEKAAIFFPRLKAVDSNLPHTEFGKMLVADEDGNLLSVEADADGTVREEYVLIEDENVMDGTLSGGKLQESTITSRELDMTEIFADSALIKQLLAENMDAAALFENEEFGERYDERYWKNFAGAELSETDLNEVTTPGRYYSATGENVENKPVEENGFLLDVLRTGEGALQQEFRTGKEIYARDGMEVQEAVEDSEEAEEIERSGVYEWKVWTRRNLSPVDLTGEIVDFNDFTFANGYTDGMWKSRYDSGTERMTNIPLSRAFVMELTAPRQASKSDYIMRMRIMYGFDKSVHERWCESGVWSAWKEYSKNGVAASAGKLETARTIALSGGAAGTAAAFDGTKDITIPVTGLDVSKANAGLLAIGRGGTGGESRAEAWNNIVAKGGTITGNLTVGPIAYIQLTRDGFSSTWNTDSRNLTDISAANTTTGAYSKLRIYAPANDTGVPSLQFVRTTSNADGNASNFWNILHSGMSQSTLWNNVVAGGGTINNSVTLNNWIRARMANGSPYLTLGNYSDTNYGTKVNESWIQHYTGGYSEWGTQNASDSTTYRKLRIWNSAARSTVRNSFEYVVQGTNAGTHNVRHGANMRGGTKTITLGQIGSGSSQVYTVDFDFTFEVAPTSVVFSTNMSSPGVVGNPGFFWEMVTNSINTTRFQVRFHNGSGLITGSTTAVTIYWVAIIN